MGACFEALLRQPLIRQRLAHAAGWNDIDDATVARLCVFAALHDIGKINIGFQAQIWRRDDYPNDQHPPGRAGHTVDLMPVLNGNDATTSEWFCDSLGWWWDATETWDDCGGENRVRTAGCNALASRAGRCSWTTVVPSIRSCGDASAS